MKDTKIQWHPGFVAAMNLEFRENRGDLVFEKEHNLNTKPLQVDLLIIKKEKAVKIKNEIGRIYRGHNIIEYKSPHDSLGIDAFYKSGAYAALYKSYGATEDERKADDITVTIIRDTIPEKLLRYFEDNNVMVTQPYAGIYYVEDAVLFPTQIVVSSELGENNHNWLRSLTDRMEEDDMRRLLENISFLDGKQDREYADSVLEVSMKANRLLVEKLKGDDNMCNALMEIMQPEIMKLQLQAKEDGLRQGIEEGRQKGHQEGRLEGRREGRQEGRLEGRQEGRLEGRQEGRLEGRQENIKNTINVLRSLNHSDTEIRKVMMENYQLTEKETEGYLRGV